MDCGKDYLVPIRIGKVGNELKSKKRRLGATNWIVADCAKNESYRVKNAEAACVYLLLAATIFINK